MRIGGNHASGKPNQKMKNTFVNPTLPGSKLPNLIPGNAIYRTYAIRRAVVAGAEVDVLGEEIGGDHPTQAAADATGVASGLRYQVKHVGGRE